MKPTITWTDGLPDDPLERAQIEQMLQSAGLSSVFSSLQRLLGDAHSAREEMLRIKEERQRAALRGAPQTQAEGTPARGELAKAQVERGESGTANDRG